MERINVLTAKPDDAQLCTTSGSGDGIGSWTRVRRKACAAMGQGVPKSERAKKRQLPLFRAT
jgi:hypothetical protein